MIEQLNTLFGNVIARLIISIPINIRAVSYSAYIGGYWVLRFVLTAFISYIIVNIGQIILKNHKKLLRYVGFVQNVLEEEDIRVKPEKVYACFNKDKDVRLSSSSGAVFSSLAEYVLNKNGIVYGVTMSEDCYPARR